MPFAGSYSPCDPGETQPYSIDFANQLVTGDSISSVANVTLVSDQPGADPNASSWLVGSASISGTIVSQVVGGSLPNGLRPGVVYRLTFTVNTTGGRTLSDSGFIPCNPIT
jgi:hypothetical protein